MVAEDPLRQMERERLTELLLHATAKFTRRWGDPPASDHVQGAFAQMLDERPSYLERGLSPARRLGQIAKTLRKNSLRRKGADETSIDADSFDEADASASPEARVLLRERCARRFAATRQHVAGHPMTLRVFDKMTETGVTEPYELVELLGVERETVYAAVRKIKDFGRKWTEEQAQAERGGPDGKAHS